MIKRYKRKIVNITIKQMINSDSQNDKFYDRTIQLTIHTAD